MQLIFVRHGQPEWAVDGLTQANPRLTELGRQQAVLTAQRLAAMEPPLTELLVSPALRSQQTAAPIVEATGLTPVTVDGLLEIQMPQWDGIPEEEVQRVFQDARHRTPEEWWQGIPGGESFRDFHDRITSTLDHELGLRGLRRDDGGRSHLWHLDASDHRIAIVAHGGTNSVSLGWLLDLEPAPWEWERFVLGHCSLAELRAIGLAGGCTFSLRTFNDREHLATDLRSH
jgi:probable phosphoglycerate mutase